MQATTPSASVQLRILVIDDHPVVLAGVRAFLGEVSDLEVISTASSVSEALSRAEILRPDAFLLTASSSHAPAEAATELRARFPEVALVVLCLDEGCVQHKDMQRLGVSAVLEKGAGREAVVTAFQMLRTSDETGMRRALARRDSAPPPPSSGRGSLSRRELQVLKLIADGNTNKQIAEQLGISVRTVETHRERLMRKLAVQGTAALTKAAIGLGLVGTD